MERPGPPNKKISLVRKKNLQKKLSKKKISLYLNQSKISEKRKRIFYICPEKKLFRFLYTSKQYLFI